MAETERVRRLEQRIERERRRREQAERIAEESTRDLYERQRELEELTATLERRVEDRTRELEGRLAQQARLAEMSGRALEGIELAQLAEELCETASEVLATDYCGVFELVGDDQVVLRAGVGWPSEAIDEKTVQARPDCQTGATLRERAPTIVEDVEADDRFAGSHLVGEADLRSGITAVVSGVDDVWGIFGVHARAPRAFDEADVSFVQSLAHLFGQAIQRERSRRELEAYANRLERVNEELDRFAHLVSHDLREPVRTVATTMDLLEREHGDALDPEARDLMDNARAAAQRLDGLIQGLLRYARLETDAETRPVDADEVLDEVVTSLAAQIEETGAELEREPLPEVEADPAQLGQVFQNLLANAIRFHEPGQRPQIEVRARPADEGWRFSVADEGVGMDPAEADELFGMFRQGEGSQSGHGIGLAVCQRIVERHGGDIWVDTAPGEGSTFHFTLPAPEDAQEGAA